MPNTTGFGPIADWIQADSEVNVYVYWDITPDRYDERNHFCIYGFERHVDARYCTYWEILYLYVTRWTYLYYEPTPITERNVYLYHCLTVNTERNVYFYLDESLRYMFVEGLLTQTPLLLKYPKYYTWEKIPRVLTPEFKIWSYYPLKEEDLTVRVISDGAGDPNKAYNKIFSKTLTPDKIIIEKVTDKIYNIKVIIDHVFEPAEEVQIYICAFDIHGNYLKPGLW